MRRITGGSRRASSMRVSAGVVLAVKELKRNSMAKMDGKIVKLMRMNNSDNGGIVLGFVRRRRR